MTWQDEVKACLLKYLELKGLKINKRSKSYSMVQCCKCKSEPLSGHYLPKLLAFNCFKCHEKFDIIKSVRELEEDKREWNDIQIYEYLITLFKLSVVTDKDIEYIKQVFAFYEAQEFEFTPLCKNSKDPVKGTKWTEQGYKKSQDWWHWWNCGLNMALICGERSKCTLIDIDTEKIPPEINNYTDDCLVQRTDRGRHLLYQYEPDLGNWKNNELKIECRNNGSLTTMFPSKIDGKSRQLMGELKLIKMPEKLKEYLISIKNTRVKTNEEGKVVGSDYRCPLIGNDEGRNDLFTHLAGRFSKFMPPKLVEKALLDVNRTICKEGEELPTNEVLTIANSIEQYRQFDFDDFTNQVYEYIKSAEQAKVEELEYMCFNDRARGTNKVNLAKALVNLIKDHKIRRRRNEYLAIKRAEWKTDLSCTSNLLPFKVPYFDDAAYFHWGEQILIGGESGTGKTTVVMNMIKRYKEQGVIVKLIELEPNKKFLKDALRLGLKEGDFLYDSYDPHEIELDEKSVIIIDWILPECYAEVDKLFYRFNQQLIKTQSFLTIFMQLKKGEIDKSGKHKPGEWFSRNMVDLFPSFATRFILDDKYTNRTQSQFIIDKQNDPKLPHIWSIPMVYNFRTNELLTMNEKENNDKSISS